MSGNSWERQENENAKSYAKFCVYRDMAYQDGKKSGKRSLESVSQTFGLKSRRSIEMLSSRHNWQSRVEDYDNYVDAKTRKSQEDTIAKMHKDHAIIANQLVIKAAQRLLTIEEKELSPVDVVRMIDTGIKLERLSRGESTENQRISGSVSHEMNVSVESKHDLSNLSDEELEELERLLEKSCKQPDV